MGEGSKLHPKGGRWRLCVQVLFSLDTYLFCLGRGAGRVCVFLQEF